ncbi:MAG: HEAT repeat domain-containing protein [Planctomycetes bacterium]|nr:HEAT repeat domain-containing protein [Planctomycetota bacterium]
MGTEAESAVAALAAALKDEDVSVRSSAVWSLQRLGPLSASAVPRLAEALEDEDPGVREMALSTLSQIGHGDAEVARAILESVRRETNRSAGSTGALRGQERLLRDTAQALGRSDPTAVAVLVRALGDDDSRVRWVGVYALGTMGRPSAKDAVPALTEALSDRSRYVAQWAAHALAQIGPPAKAALPRLTEALAHEDALLRVRAAEAIWRIDPQGGIAVVPVLIDVLLGKEEGNHGGVQQMPPGARETNSPHDEKPELDMIDQIQPIVEGETALAADILGRMGPVAVPALIELLNHRERGVRYWATRSLASIGADASAAVPALLGRLEDEDPNIRIGAAMALVRIDREEAGGRGIKYLIDTLKNPRDLRSRIEAASALNEISPLPEEAVRALREAAQDGGGPLAKAAGEALKKVDRTMHPSATTGSRP